MQKEQTEFIIIITTCSSQKEAEKLASILVEKRLAACAQVSGPITSFYWWEDNIEKDKEWQVKFKTLSTMFDQACETIKKNHSYEVPQILSLKIDQILPKYAAWLTEETAK